MWIKDLMQNGYTILDIKKMQLSDIEDHEEIQSMISKDYAKYLKSFSAQMDITPADCIKQFLQNELDK